jgi:hypothetical protein
MHCKVLTVAVCLVLAASVRDAFAQVGQPWTDRGYFNLNVGFVGGADDLAETRTFRLPNDTEDGTLEVTSGVDSGSLIDFAVGSRVWRNVSLGLGFHRGSTSADGTLRASVPNPVLTDRPREVALSISDLDRTEQAVHLLFGYMLPVNEELSVHFTIGPSFFRLKQEVVSDATYTEEGFPFTSVTATPLISERTDSATGFNIGVDAAYKLYETPTIKLGAGVFLRYAGATGKIQILDNVADSDVGGVQIGFGGRLRF